MAGIPFFISGSGRSGSTYLYHRLRAHPKVAITNETRILDGLWRSYQSVALPYGQTTPDGLRGVVMMMRDPRDVVEAVKAVFDHMGLPFHPAILSEVESNSTLGTHGSSESAEASIGRWRRDLSSEAEHQVVDVCGPVMSRLGLAEDPAEKRTR